MFIILCNAVPSISVSISESGTPTALRSYTLTCVVNASQSLDFTSSSYRWFKNGSVQSEQTSSQLNFGSLPLSENNSVYTCQYTASSVYLNSNVDIRSAAYPIWITSMCVLGCFLYIHDDMMTQNCTIVWAYFFYYLY